jgi:hypothetical protein
MTATTTQWLLVWRVRYKVIPRPSKTQGTRGQIGAEMALVGKRDKCPDGRLNLIGHSIGGVRVFGYEFPNGVKVNFSVRVKIIPCH